MPPPWPLGGEVYNGERGFRQIRPVEVLNSKLPFSNFFHTSFLPHTHKHKLSLRRSIFVEYGLDSLMTDIPSAIPPKPPLAGTITPSTTAYSASQMSTGTMSNGTTNGDATLNGDAESSKMASTM